jgi:flagellar hook-associated protein 2
MAIQATGVGSGLDVNGIVSQLMALERRPLDLLDQKEASFNAKLSAYGSVQSVLGTLQSAARALATPQKFALATARMADTSIAGAAAGAGAATGSYGIEVQALAQAQKLRTGAFATTAATVGAGTLTIEFGSYSGGAFSLNPAKAAQTVSIAAGQDSLAAVRDAINGAGAGVQASIVNDGSGERLVIASRDSGAANSLRIAVDDADGNHGDAAGLSRLAYDASSGGASQLVESVAGRDAVVVIDGITVTRPSNSVSGAIEGVTLSLAKAAPGSTTTLTVARDVDGMKAALDAFVKAYNDAAAALRNLSAYDAETRTAAVLQGDAALRSVQSRLRAALGAAVQFAGGYDSLSALGIAVQRDGSLLADSAKLRAALADPARDAATALAAVGKPSDSLIEFSGASAAAEPGEYALVVTQLATRGSATGSAAAALTVTAGVNDTLQLSVDGGAATSVTLPAGTYTAAGLAALLQSRIEGVEVSQSAGALTITSKSWGSRSSVSLTGGSALADLFGAPSSTAGVDAAGTIGGVAATGDGRSLTAKGLSVAVEGGATGARGTVVFSRGIADRLDVLIDDLLDNSLAARTEGLNASKRSLEERRVQLERRMESIEARIRAQFVALDSMIASMNATQSFLTQQLAALPRIAGTED